MTQIAIDSQLSSLIGRFYEAAADNALWDGIASDISVALKSTSAVLKLHGDSGEIRLLEHTDNLGVPSSKQSWARHWHQHDLWVERSAAVGLSRVVTDRDLVTRTEQRKSGFYQEWLRALDIHHMVGAVFPAGDSSLAVLGVHRPERAGAYEEGDRRKLTLLLPHLQRALWLGQRLSKQAAHTTIAEEALQRIDAAVFALDAHCHIVTTNHRAEALLHDDKHSFAVSTGRLKLADSLLNQRLIEQVRSSTCTAQGKASALGSVMLIPRRNRLALTMMVTPLPLHNPPLSGAVTQDRPLALVMIRDPEAPKPALDCLRQLFGFTRTEAVVAANLATGLSLDAVAQRCGMGGATVRSHFKSILAKTGTHRQAEAVAQIARSVAGLDADRAFPP